MMTSHRCGHCANWWASNSNPECQITTKICPNCIPKLFPHKLSAYTYYRIHKATA